MTQNQISKPITTESTTPRIYVASLADYNAGRLHGRWIDADQPAGAIHEEIAQMLAESKEPVAEDWAIHDHANLGGLYLSEFEDIDKLAEAAFLIAEHGTMFAGLLNHFGGLCGLDDARRYMEEGYRGSYENVTEYAEQLLDDCYSDVLGNLPDILRYHIDYEGIARDMEYGGDILTIECDHVVHVFDAHI